jgi:hypothetical protein
MHVCLLNVRQTLARRQPNKLTCVLTTSRAYKQTHVRINKPHELDGASTLCKQVNTRAHRVKYVCSSSSNDELDYLNEYLTVLAHCFCVRV